MHGVGAPDPQPVPDVAAFIEASPSPFHAVAEAARRLTAAGFVEVDERSDAVGSVERGYVVRDGSVVAWAGLDGDDRLRMIGAHTDSPNLRVKPRPDLGRAGARQVALEPYGGVLLNSWLGRDLGLAGRVALRDGSLPLVRSRTAVLHLPQLAIHLDREIGSKGLLLDPQRHTAALSGLGVGLPGDFVGWLAGELGVAASEVVAWDVMTHDALPPQVVGTDGSLLSSPRLDNLCSAWAAVEALLAAGRGIVALWDHEEVGSSSNRGAGSPLVDAVLERAYPDPAVRRGVVARSFCASSDMAHATHPNYPEKHEPSHPIDLGGGPVIKTNVNQRYATDARSAGVFVAACEAAGVPVQWYAHRADLPCGSTIGPITAARLGMSVVDVGAPMLAMHSARELMAVADADLLRRALTSFLEA
jgi:aspartyl aminopeptidase